MQKTAILFASLMFALFLAGSVSALYTCEDSQTILKLGSYENAHVELHNQSLYSLKLCYSDIYGINYTLSNPHVCSGSNIVSKLAQSTNSHIESPNGTLFSNPVCYGDLSCSLRNSCLSNEKLVLTLAQPTNSHVSFNDTLPWKLCCSSPFALSNQNSSGNQSNNQSTGDVYGLIINAPWNGSTYNDAVPIDITIGTANQVNYSIDGGQIFSYSSSVSVPLPAGNHYVIIQASNSTSFFQTIIYFTIIDSNSGSNSGSSGGGSGKGTKVGESLVSGTSSIQSEESGSDTLFLESESSKKLSTWISSSFVWVILFLLLLILLAILLALLLRKKNQENKRK